jgi:hypothetical protein
LGWRLPEAPTNQRTVNAVLVVGIRQALLQFAIRLMHSPIVSQTGAIFQTP